MTKQAYRAAPALIEYGRIEQLTFGNGGALPDYYFDENFQLISVSDNACDPSEPNQRLCGIVLKGGVLGSGLI